MVKRLLFFLLLSPFFIYGQNPSRFQLGGQLGVGVISANVNLKATTSERRPRFALNGSISGIVQLLPNKNTRFELGLGFLLPSDKYRVVYTDLNFHFPLFYGERYRLLIAPGAMLGMILVEEKRYETATVFENGMEITYSVATDKTTFSPKFTFGLSLNLRQEVRLSELLFLHLNIRTLLQNGTNKYILGSVLPEIGVHVYIKSKN